MSKRLSDKVALITGAASGQGAAELALFVKEGAKVIATDINDKLLNQHVECFKRRIRGRNLTAEVRRNKRS